MRELEFEFSIDVCESVKMFQQRFGSLFSEVTEEFSGASAGCVLSNQYVQSDVFNASLQYESESEDSKSLISVFITRNNDQACAWIESKIVENSLVGRCEKPDIVNVSVHPRPFFLRP